LQLHYVVLWKLYWFAIFIRILFYSCAVVYDHIEALTMWKESWWIKQHNTADIWTPKVWVITLKFDRQSIILLTGDLFFVKLCAIYSWYPFAVWIFIIWFNILVVLNLNNSTHVLNLIDLIMPIFYSSSEWKLWWIKHEWLVFRTLLVKIRYVDRLRNVVRKQVRISNCSNNHPVNNLTYNRDESTIGSLKIWALVMVEYVRLTSLILLL